ncbi:MAG: sigma-54-dependent Fis family transcriptional regulator [Nitrospirae bacterium]|nr:sigma-54-dependent Fis family transcriptional regulator [Nitrospirota bacterium]
MNISKLPVLLVDDEEDILFSYSLMLRTAGLENIMTIKDSREVLPFLSRQEAAVIVLDLIMPHIHGRELLGSIKLEYPYVPVIIMTATGELEPAIECMKAGAMDYLIKPVEKCRFQSSILRAMELRELHDEVYTLRKHLFSDTLEHEEDFTSIITRSKKMRIIFHYVEAVAGSMRPACIFGETGVGKELIAGIIHKVSGGKGEFIAVNIAGLDDNMFSDTIFGHKKGAFTGADTQRRGLLSMAEGGTLLLDEIGDLTEASQVKLLRVIEEGMYYPVGSDTPERNNARIIATTNKDLSLLIKDGKFRKDLYYRLNTHYIHIPPLRERLEDVSLLLEHFLATAAKTFNKKKPTPPPELVTYLATYDFPGNIRELQSMVFDAVAQHKSGILSMDSFRQVIKKTSSYVHSVSSNIVHGIGQFSGMQGHFPKLKEAEEFLINEALKRANGNQGAAASLLGLTRQALNKRLIRGKGNTHNSNP